jgi:transcriptional regulator with XRE-family HTH domain
MNHVALGKRIRQFRINRGMSQSQLAEKLNVSYQQIQKYEKGDSQIKISRLLQIAKALEMEPLALVPDFTSASKIFEPGKHYKAHHEKRLELTGQEKRLIEDYRKIKNADLKNDILKLVQSIALLRKR